MKRSILIIISLFFVLGVPAVSSAGVSVSIGIPSPFAFAAPPDMVVVPSGEAYIYMVPGTIGLYFYDNWWYRFDDGHWFRSRTYNGRWAYVERHRIPRYVIDVPPDYYSRLPRGYHRIPYGDFHSHWRSWDRDRHWNRYEWYKREHREHMRSRELHHERRYDDRRDERHDRRGDRREDRREDHRDDRGGHGGRR